MRTSCCEWCGIQVIRNGTKAARFCSLNCKGEWQRTQKPVGRDWLYQKYVTEGWSTYRIGKAVGRDPKRVFEWLTDYGIPLRKRAWNAEAGSSPLDDPEWLRREYIEKSRAAGDIGQGFGLTATAVLYFLRKHAIPRRSMRETRAVKHWGADGEKNPQFGKRGPAASNWRGGSTPERQGFYSSLEWIAAAKVVWKRDHGTCQRCGVLANDSPRGSFHIHHIVPFAVKQLRAEPSNLVLLCNGCHRWAHSKKNVEGLFILNRPKEGGEG